MILYTEKYEPLTLNNMLGNEHCVTIIKSLLYDTNCQNIMLYGPSGCGKSTLIKILLGLYSYDGDIFIDNINIKDIDYNYYNL